MGNSSLGRASSSSATSARATASLVRTGLRANASKKIQTALEELEAEAAACEQLRKELDGMKKKLSQESVNLAEAEAEAEAAKIKAEKKVEVFQQKYDQAEEEKRLLVEQGQKINNSFSTEDISSYLNQVIKDFNDSTESDNDIATYVINNMDVDLKVRIYGDGDKNKLKFLAPSVAETSEDSISSIKISIQAVPK